MDQHRNRFDRFMPQSTFGVTFLTIAIIILVLGFFARGIQSVSDSPEGYVDMADRQKKTFDALLPLDLQSPDANDSEDVELTAGNRIRLWGHYGDNRAELSLADAPEYVASLLSASDCRWTDDSTALPIGAQLHVGQTLDITAGLVEIAFTCGAKAIIEGPAVLELKSEKSGTLLLGRITADVPDDVEGFTVTTPLAQLVSISKAERESAAKLTATVDCLWEKGSTVTEKGTYLNPGSMLKLAGGLAEISFSSGAKVIVQGPAILEIGSSKTAILHSGKVTADVPDDLEGFKILTPLAEVLSLPTIATSADDQQQPAKEEDKDASAEVSVEDAPASSSQN